MEGPAEAQQDRPIADQKGDAFHRCASHMALWTLRRIDGQIDKSRVANEVLSDCILQAPDDALIGPQSNQDAWMAQAKRDVAALIEKLAPRAKVEKAIEDQAGANYFLCLKRHAQVLALATNEAADIVAQASLSACPAERAAVAEVHRRYDDVLSEGAMKVMDNGFAQQLLLEIVQIRAQRNIGPAPTPAPTPRKTPI
jgi:hypothetical protein